MTEIKQTSDMSTVLFLLKLTPFDLQEFPVFEVAALMVINYISHRCDNVPLTVLTSAIQTRPILSAVCRNADLFLF